MKLKLSTGQVIELPSGYNERERLALVKQIIREYPEEFTYSSTMFGIKYGQRQDNNRLVKIKLDILSTYLIRSDDKYTRNVMSRYKEEKRPLQEMSFSQLNPNLVEINGWY